MFSLMCYWNVCLAVCTWRSKVVIPITDWCATRMFVWLFALALVYLLLHFFKLWFDRFYLDVLILCAGFECCCCCLIKIKYYVLVLNVMLMLFSNFCVCIYIYIYKMHLLLIEICYSCRVLLLGWFGVPHWCIVSSTTQGHPISCSGIQKEQQATGIGERVV